MPKYPTTSTLTGNTIDILNAIRNGSSLTYQERVPVATQTNIKEVGDAILSFTPNANEFLNALVNRIGMVILTSKEYTNPLKPLKKGILEFGETIEEIFVNIAKAHNFDSDTASREIYKREIPDVKSAFHTVDLKNFYKATVEDEQLRLAFLSYDGVTNLITGIINSLYTGSELDEFLCMKNQLAYGIQNERFEMVEVPDVTQANAKEITAIIKEWSNKLTFMSNNYNYSGVATHTPKENQIILVSSKLDALMDVEVLASAFNLPYVDFLNQRILVDDFGTDDSGEPITDVVCAIIDKDFLQCYDNLLRFTEKYNEEGLYWNYWYHIWKIFSISPFANAVAFTTADVEVTSVTVSPDSATLGGGDTQQFTATVVVTGYAPKDVEWSISGQTSDDTVIDKVTGLLTIGDDETDEGTITVTAKSVYDTTVTDTATVTIDNE